MADNTTLNAGAGGDVIASDDIGGVKHQRIKLVHGADGVNDGDVSKTNPLPVVLGDTDKTIVHYWATAAAAGATGVEGLISITRSAAPGGNTSAGTTAVPTAGKRFRITGITFAARGNATATAQVTTFSIRVNPAGAASTASNPWLQVRVATPATASAWDRITVPLPPEGIEMVGDGTLSFGISANAVYVTNAPTWDVLITGYEY